MESGAEQVKTRFNSITPLILKLRDIIFGVQKPDLYTRIAAYINLLIWFIFFVWHIIGYTAISLRAMIFDEKNINVEELIFKRGEELWFKPYEFLNLLMKYHLVSLICWAVVFVGIAFMWRRKRIFAFFLLGSLAVYYAQLFFWMGWNYFMQDTTVFDKALMVVITLNSLLYFFLMPTSKPVTYHESES